MEAGLICSTEGDVVDGNPGRRRTLTAVGPVTTMTTADAASKGSPP
jgi:hypothetical protein